MSLGGRSPSAPLSTSRQTQPGSRLKLRPSQSRGGPVEIRHFRFLERGIRKVGVRQYESVYAMAVYVWPGCLTLSFSSLPFPAKLGAISEEKMFLFPLPPRPNPFKKSCDASHFPRD